MDQNTLQQQIETLNGKLDLLLEEVELQRRHRRELEDFKDDIMRIAKDALQSAVVELEEVHDHFQMTDLLHLVKKLMRNVNTITEGIEQLENLKEFFEDFTPISKELFLDAIKTLDELDRKGYFEFLKEVGKISDRVITNFTVEDVQHLGDNIVTILNTVKNVTQPDMLHAVNNAISVYNKLDIEVAKDVSLFSLLKEVNTPEMKRGLAFGIQLLKSLANAPRNGNPQNVLATKRTN